MLDSLGLVCKEDKFSDTCLKTSMAALRRGLTLLSVLSFCTEIVPVQPLTYHGEVEDGNGSDRDSFMLSLHSCSNAPKGSLDCFGLLIHCCTWMKIDQLDTPKVDCKIRSHVLHVPEFLADCHLHLGASVVSAAMSLVCCKSLVLVTSPLCKFGESVDRSTHMVGDKSSTAAESCSSRKKDGGSLVAGPRHMGSGIHPTLPHAANL